MKIVDAPKDAILQKMADDGGNKTVPFREFLELAMDQYEAGGKGLKNIRQAVKIMDAVASMNGTLALEDADFEVLQDAVRKSAWRPKAARAFLPFYEALETPQEVKK